MTIKGLPELEILLYRDRIRSMFTPAILGFGVPAWLFLAVLGQEIAAAVVWGLGVISIYIVEHWLGSALRDYLLAVNAPVPDWLERSYLFVKRTNIPIDSTWLDDVPSS